MAKRTKKQTRPKEIIYSKIKEGELFVETTAKRDIKRVFFNDSLLVDLTDIDSIFLKLNWDGFIKLEKVNISGVQIFKCLKQWKTDSITASKLNLIQ